MKHQSFYGIRIASFILIVAIATVLIAGCTDTASVKQSPTTSTTSPQSGHAAAGTAAKTTVLPASTVTTQPALTQAAYAKSVSIYPISDKKTGDKFTITGTTVLPADTGLFWEIIPAPKTAPTGIDLNAQTGIMANNYVKKGNGSSNTVSLDVDTKDMKAGKYVVIVASLNGNADPSAGTMEGYTYFTLD
jgi:hypothetical protein